MRGGQRVSDQSPEDKFQALEQYCRDLTDLARAVSRTNDERAAVKRRINKVSGSTLMEEKSYADYVSPDRS